MDPRVYLAGPITKNWWRNCIFGGENTKCRIPSQEVNDLGEYFDKQYQADGFVVTGPHSIGCDHGCYHQGYHAATDENECAGFSVDEGSITYACEVQIIIADFVYAYIDSLEAYGTFAEIGFAKGMGRPVFILFKDQALKDSLWFLCGMATETYVATNYLAERLAFKETFENSLYAAKAIIKMKEEN